MEEQIPRKKLIWPKVLIIVGILILIIMVVTVITLRQVSSTMMTVKTESNNIRSEIKSMMDNKNCDGIPKIIESKDNMVKSLNSACANPIIKIYIEKSDRALKCGDVNRIDGIASTWLTNMKNLCENRPRLYEAFQNKTLEVPSELNSLLS